MGRFRPRGNRGQRVAGKAASIIVNEMHKGNKNKTDNNGCLIILGVLFFLFLIVNECNG